jgi:signal transduction histidine kinase/DNA-binding response OmpR family regulator
MPNRPSRFRYRVYNGLLLFAALVLTGTSIMSLRATNELQRSVVLASHSQRILEQISHFWGLLGDSESHGLRFLITGQEQYLIEYRHTNEQMGRALDQLAALSADDPTQMGNVRSLQRLFTERAQYASTTQQLKLQANHGDAVAERAIAERLRGNEGSRYLAELKNVRDRMVRAEDTRLALRSEQRNQMIRQNWATVLVANGLALVAGLVGFSATRRLQLRAQEAFRAELQAEQARRSSQDKSVFLASMSHEIRTPMNAIFGFTNLLAESVKEPTQAEYVASIRKSGQALLSLINDVLDLSKMEAGKLELREEPTDLREIVDQILTMFRHIASAKGIDLRAEYDGLAQRPLMIDPVRFRQILINLVSNAVKYTDHGGIVVRIGCRKGERDGHCDLRAEVADSGTGIAAHQLGVIFEPFEQGDSPDGKAREGTGLGLSIARRLAALMGGRLRAESALGEGSVFILEVPDRTICSDPVTQQPTDAAVVDFDRLPPLEVLVVDDVAWNRELVAAYLRDSHHQVRHAGDGQAAVEEVRRERPDVVLMDLRMPRLSGEQALLRIKSDPDSAEVPVIAVTASSMSADESWLRTRFDGYVRKPFSKADLFEALAAHFRAESAPAPDAPAAAPPAALSSRPGNPDADALAELARLRAADLPALRANLRMREAALAAETLARLAATLAWPALATYAAALAQAVDAFDVPAIRQLLDDCPTPEVAPP